MRGYTSRPVRGRKAKQQRVSWLEVRLQSTPRQGTTIPYGPYDYELQFLPRYGTETEQNAYSDIRFDLETSPVRGRPWSFM